MPGTYYLDTLYVADKSGNSTQTKIGPGGTGSPVLGLAFLYAEDPTDIDFNALSVDEKTNGVLLGELIVNNHGPGSSGSAIFNTRDTSDSNSYDLNTFSTYSYNTAHLYTFTITGEDADLVEISPLGYLRIKSDVEVYRYQDQTLDFTLTATSPTGVSYSENFSLPVNAYQHTITYADGINPMAGITITMTESDGTITTLTTDANGQVTLPSTANTYTLTASQTEKGDDPISLIDAIHILQYGGELRTLDAGQLIAADVNADGEVDILDAIWILQHLGELRTLDSDFVFLDTATGKLLSETTFNPTDIPSITVIRMGDVDQDFDPTTIDAASLTAADISINGESTTANTDLSDSDFTIVDDNEPSYLGSWAHEFNASDITLPETVMDEIATESFDLTDLYGLLGSQTDSLGLNFDAFVEDTGIEIEAMKPMDLNTFDPVLDHYQDSWLEDLVYSSELG